MERAAPTTIDRSLTDCIVRAEADAESGEFSAILATNQEASDGHILSLRGLEQPAEVSMFFNHQSTAEIPSLGVIPKGRKIYTSGLEELQVRPRIDLEGDDSMAGTRRGIFQLVKSGGLKAMSLRWDTKKSERRINLSKDHAAFIDAEKISSDDQRYWGHFISRSVELEGSIVGLGADRNAVIARADDAEDRFTKVFFTTLARSIEQETMPDQMGDISQALAAFQESLGEVRDLGMSNGDIAQMIAGDVDLSNLREVHYTTEGGEDRSVWLPVDAWAEFEGESLERMRAAMQLEREPVRAAPVEVPEIEKAPIGPNNAVTRREYDEGLRVLSEAIREGILRRGR